MQLATTQQYRGRAVPHRPLAFGTPFRLRDENNSIHLVYSPILPRTSRRPHSAKIRRVVSRARKRSTVCVLWCSTYRICRYTETLHAHMYLDPRASSHAEKVRPEKGIVVSILDAPCFQRRQRIPPQLTTTYEDINTQPYQSYHSSVFPFLQCRPRRVDRRA